MGQLRDRMEGDLLLKGLAEVTRAEYLRCATQLAAHYRRSPAELGAEDLRAYLFHLARTLNYSPANLKMHVAAIKFLYTVTLNRPDLVARLPYPKVPRPLLDTPSPGESGQGAPGGAHPEVPYGALLCLRRRPAPA
jgi:integrase/recombinase XerD